MEGIINIAGVMPRIGTTTVALQLIYFLGIAGYTAAYVEINGQDYIWAITKTYRTGTHMDKDGTVSFHGIDLYRKERLSELVSGGSPYDYIICDYGNLRLNKFCMNDFVKCGAMLLVAGFKPNEVFFTEMALREPALQDAIYILSFSRAEDRADILKLMRHQAAQTVFAPYMPDPLVPAKGTEAEACFLAVMDHVVERMQGGGL